MMPPPLPNLPPPVAPTYAAPPAPAPVPVYAPAPVPVGYPVPGAAPAVAQGYPGPAVAAPLPAPVPAAPVPAPAYAAPQPAYAPAPAYPAAQPQAYAAPVMDIGAAIASATGGDKAPQLAPGFSFIVEVTDSRVTTHPQKRTLTFIADLKILKSNNPAQPEGAEVVYIEGLQWGGARVREFLVAACGYPAESVLRDAYRAAGQDPEVAIAALANAAANPATTPIKGKRLHVSTMTVTRTPKSGPNTGKPTDYLSLTWAPHAA
jgi:hypothetical protein